MGGGREGKESGSRKPNLNTLGELRLSEAHNTIDYGKERELES